MLVGLIKLMLLDDDFRAHRAREAQLRAMLARPVLAERFV